VEGTLERALGGVDAPLEAGERRVSELEGVTAGEIFIRDASHLVFPEFGIDCTEPAKQPLIADESIDEAAFFRCGWFEALVVFGDKGFQVGLVLRPDEERFRIDAGFQGIAAGDGLAFGGARPG
jgi:hypothetical protein